MKHVVWLAPAAAVLLVAACAIAQTSAQQAMPIAPQAAPIAIVPLDANARSGEAATVTGALEVTGGRTMIAASGTVTAGSRPARVILPRRGELKVCASTTVKLAADASMPSSGAPGLLLAMDHGAVELSLAGGNVAKNSDVILTPDFRILVSAPGAAEVKVRLGAGGDTCVDNAGASAPYVLVSSVFEGGAYRVQPGQRVAFQHGSLHEVVDQEKEPCGCPPAARGANEFPLAQSEGLEPLAAPAPSNGGPLVSEPLVRQGTEKGVEVKSAPEAGKAAAQTPAVAPKKSGFFAKVGAFFRKIFGAE
ncbi:MAG: hypothetical protein P4K83_06415 [Terracidiphilus sp.]|nr:hypothetical protein [Terracidiphilus sp.]